MSARASRRRPWGGTLIAFERDDGRTYLPAITATATFLAALAIAVTLAAAGIAAQWRGTLARALTVEIEAHADSDAQVAAALQLLRASAGIAQAEALPRARVVELVAPWLGDPRGLEGLPLPTIIDIRLAPGATIDAIALAARVTAVAPSARLDDHRAWRDTLISASRLVIAVAAAVLVAVIAATTLAVVFATRARLAVHKEHVAILHLMGALDRTIAREFAIDAAKRAGLGGLLGLGAAIVLLAVLARWARALDAAALPLPELAPLDWLAIAAALPAGILLASATAWIAARAALRALP